MIGNFKAPNKPPQGHPPLAEMERLRTYATLDPKFEWMHRVEDSVIQIISHNVQSLRKHKKSIECDPIFTSSHLLLLQETWILAHESFNIPNYREVQRNLFNGRPSAKGTIIYAKDSSNVLADVSYCKESLDQHIEITSCVMNNIKVVNIYKNPKSSLEFLKTTLLEKQDLFNHDNVLLCGDNTDFTKTRSTEDFLRQTFGLSLLYPKLSTTNENSTIDAVFGKLSNYKCNVSIYESLFSYDKPLVIRLYEKL